MPKKSVGGRPAIYAKKDGAVQVRAITKTGARIMNTARTVVKQLTRWPGKVTDSDICDYVLRCWYHGRESADEEIKAED